MIEKERLRLVFLLWRRYFELFDAWVVELTIRGLWRLSDAAHVNLW
jgi:hypothetical protein